MAPSCRIALGALFVGACVEPIQYGGPIPIDAAGLQARLSHLCVLTGQTTGCETLAASPEDEPAEPAADAR